MPKSANFMPSDTILKVVQKSPIYIFAMKYSSCSFQYFPTMLQGSWAVYERDVYDRAGLNRVVLQWGCLKQGGLQ